MPNIYFYFMRNLRIIYTLKYYCYTVFIDLTREDFHNCPAL